MSEASKAARKAMKDKIGRITRVDPSQRVDASDYTTPGLLNADVKTGARPVRGRRYKSGGKVHGEHSKIHAGRKPRKSGGRALATPDNLLNRDMVEANESRDGTKHVGAFKHGGRTGKAMGGGMTPMKAAILAQILKARHSGMGRGVPAGMAPPPMQRNPVMPTPMAGALPMGRKHGGRAHKMYGGGMTPTPMGIGAPSVGMQPSMMQPNLAGLGTLGGQPNINMGAGLPLGRKSGGRTMKHDDAAEDKKLIKKVVKKDALKHGMANGGKTEYEDCPECGGYGYDRSEPEQDSGAYHPCYNCGTSGRVSVQPKGQSRKSIQKRDRREAASMEGNRRTLKEVLKAKSPPKYEDDETPFKRGGRTKRASGGRTSVSDGELEGTRPTGGRLAKKGGGSVVIVNIGKKSMGDEPSGAPMGGLPPPPMALPPAAWGMPPGGPAGGPPMPPPPMGGGMPPMMPRKSGGRVRYPIHDGAGGGKGRLQKIKAYGDKAFSSKK